MKFKSVFAVFNIVVLLSFAFIFIMPFFALGGQYAGEFWAANWPLSLILLAAIGALDVFFALNWKLFSLLEREDWPALANHLEQLVVRKGRYRSSYVRLLTNAYLVLSDTASAIALERTLAEKKPSLVHSNALLFGVARILSGDHHGAAEFLAAESAAKTEDPEWVRWYYSFALLLDKRFGEGADVLVSLAAGAKDPLVLGLASFFLSTTAAAALPSRKAELEAAASSAAGRTKAALPDQKSWDKALSKAGSEIYIVVLSKSLKEAAAALYE